ncbi:MAG: M48 family metallopeptidase [Puniceicoccaceae bacterium]
MDFFQAQDDARKKTKVLVFYYAMAVIIITLAVYAAVTVGFVYYQYQTKPSAAIDAALLYDPIRFLLVVAGVGATIGLGSLYKVMTLRSGGSAVAESLGGERVDRSTKDPKRKMFLNVVEEMAIASGVPVPEVYILKQEAAINAFAAGWSAEDAVIAVSAGALNELSRDELQGVVAHEYSHVLYGDCRMNIRLMGVLFGIMMLSVFGRIMRIAIGGGRRRRGGMVYVGGSRRRSSSSGKGGGAAIIAVIIVIVLVTIIGYIGTFFGRLIQAAISRQREYLADAAAVQFTRNPEGIAGALKRIAVNTYKSELLHPNASEAAHMFFADGIERSFSAALSTHPPLEQRIRAIQPNWDGKYEAAKKKSKPARTEAKKDLAQEKASAAFPIGAGGSGMEKLQGMVVLGAIGSMSTENLDTARQITSSIPDDLDARMRQSDGASHAIIALLLVDNTEDDVKQAEIIRQYLEDEDVQAVEEVEKQIATMPRKGRLAVMELATTTLTQVAEFEREGFYDLIDSLIRADDKVTPYEYCMRRILRERLKRGQGIPSGKAGLSYSQVDDELGRSISTVLSFVAQASSGSKSGEELVQGSLEGLYLLMHKVQWLGDETPGLDVLDEAFDQLKLSSFAIRSQFLRAVVACIKEDGELSAAEAEMLRMFGLSLDCPIPPLGI